VPSRAVQNPVFRFTEHFGPTGLRASAARTGEFLLRKSSPVKPLR
jgi:hypothetical protein